MKSALAATYFAGMLAQVIIRAPYARRARRVMKFESRISAPERAVLAALTVGGLILPLVYALTDWLAFADYPFPTALRVPLGILGVIVLVPALWLFLRAHRDFGAWWSSSLELSAHQPLVTHGVYGRIRHPMYASQLLFGVSQALLLHNWLGGLGGILNFVLLYFIRIPEEEAMMLARFGEEYRAHAGSAPAASSLTSEATAGKR